MERAGRSRALALAAALLVAPSLSGCVPDLSKPFPRKTVYALTFERPSVAARPQGAASATLLATEVPPTSPANDRRALRVMRVRTAPLFERKGLVYRTGEETYESDFYREYYAPPGIVLHEALVGWLEQSQIASDILSGGEMEPADWLLEVRIDELYFDLREPSQPSAHLGLSLTLRNARSAASDPALRRRYALTRAAASRKADALVRALEEAVSETLGQIEADLRPSLE